MKVIYIAGIILVLVLGAMYALILRADERSDDQPSLISSMKLTSPAFENGTPIPQEFSCDANTPVSPQLEFTDIPEGTISLALVVDDPDVPTEVRPEGVFDHWVLFNIPPDSVGVPQGGSAGTMGVNGAGNTGYRGPCPPPEYQPTEHRYFFRLYALDTELPLEEGATKQQVLDAMEGHIIEQAELMGTYDRAN